MRLAPVLIVASFLVAPALAQESKAFKDWVVGCDNLRACTALGLPSDNAQVGSYVKVIRGGEGTAEPNVVFVTYVDSPEPGATLALAFDDQSVTASLRRHCRSTRMRASSSPPFQAPRRATSSARSTWRTA